MAKTSKIPTDDQYAEAWREFESGKVKMGLWAKLYVEAEGDDKKTKAAYIKQLALSARNHRLYARAWKEVGGGDEDEGLWARLFAETEGDENKTKVAYLKERTEQFRDEVQRKREEKRKKEESDQREMERVRAEQIEKERLAKEELREQRRLEKERLSPAEFTRREQARLVKERQQERAERQQERERDEKRQKEQFRLNIGLRKFSLEEVEDKITAVSDEIYSVRRQRGCKLSRQTISGVVRIAYTRIWNKGDIAWSRVDDVQIKTRILNDMEKYVSRA
jgi:hypothetical protein